VLVAPALGLAQADAVDDGGVVQLVADDGVGLGQQRLEQAAVGVEGRRIEDGVLQADEARDALFQRLVQVLGAADEAHRAEAVAVGAQGLMRGLDDGRVAGQAQVVVGAEVDDLAPVRRVHQGALGGGEDAFGLVETGVTQGVQFLAQVGLEVIRGGHGGLLCWAAFVYCDLHCSIYRT